MAFTSLCNKPLETRKAKANPDKDEKSQWKLDVVASEQSILGDQFADAVALVATGNYDRLVQKAHKPPQKTIFWEEPKYNPPIANTHICYEYDAFYKEDERYWQRTGNRFMTGKRIDPPNFEGPLKYEEVPHCIEKPIKMYGRKREEMPFVRAHPYNKPVHRIDPTNAIQKAYYDKRTSLIGPTTYKLPDLWSESSYGSLPQENSVFKSDSIRFEHQKSHKVDFRDEKDGTSIPHSRGRSRGGGFREPPKHTSISDSRKIRNISDSASGDFGSRGASRSQQQPESGFVDGGGSLSSWQSFQPAPGGSSINGGVPTGSSGKMEQHLKRPINRPGTVGSGNVYGSQGREFFMDSEGNVYEETPAPKSFFEELNIATVQSPSGGAPTTSAGGVGSRGGSPGGAPGVQMDPSRFYELSQAPTQEQQQLQQVLARGKSGLPHPFSRRSSAKRGSYDHEDLDSTAEIIMTKIESVTKARKQAAQARVPGFSFVKKVTSSSFGALENEKVYRRVMLPDGTHAIVPVVPGQDVLGAPNSSTKVIKPSTSLSRSHSDLHAQIAKSRSYDSNRDRDRDAAEGGRGAGGIVPWSSVSSGDEYESAAGASTDDVPLFQLLHTPYNDFGSVTDLSVPSIPLPRSHTPPVGKRRVKGKPSADLDAIASGSGSVAGVQSPLMSALESARDTVNIPTMEDSIDIGHDGGSGKSVGGGGGGSSVASSATPSHPQPKHSHRNAASGQGKKGQGLTGTGTGTGMLDGPDRKPISIISIMDDEVSSVGGGDQQYQHEDGLRLGGMHMHLGSEVHSPDGIRTSTARSHATPPAQRSFGSTIIQKWGPAVQYSNRKKEPIPLVDVGEKLRQNAEQSAAIRLAMSASKASGSLSGSASPLYRKPQLVAHSAGPSTRPSTTHSAVSSRAVSRSGRYTSPVFNKLSTREEEQLAGLRYNSRPLTPEVALTQMLEASGGRSPSASRPPSQRHARGRTADPLGAASIVIPPARPLSESSKGK